MRLRGPTFAGIGLAAALLGQGACGGGSSPGSPTPAPQPSPTPTPPPATTDRWTVSGRVITLGDGRPVGGAQVTSEVGPTIQTDAGGQFTLGSDRNPPVNPHGFTIDAPGYLARTAYVRRQDGRREGITFDVIPLAAPFSLDFYRAFVRNTHDAPSDLELLRRWTTNPRFYVRTVDAEGRPIEPEVLDLVLSTIPDAVREFTGGQIAAGPIETGADVRPLTTNWINVNILRDPASDVCGRARVGADPGEITLYDDRCGCGSQKIRARTVAHEVGHALGFWHVPGPDAVMTSTASGCPSARPSDQERFHGAIAYRRFPGNRDPDADPQHLGAAQLRAITVDGPVISCRLR